MFLSILFIKTSFPFNTEFNGIFKNTFHSNITSLETSGNYFCYDESLKEDVLSKPENCVDPDSKLEWCSTYDYSNRLIPFLQMNFKDSVRISGYSMKLGCCYTSWCCCRIYSWKLEGSNDNSTWEVIHSEEKQKDFKECNERSFEVKSPKFFRMIKLTQTEAYPSCPSCIGLAKFELYGDLDDSNYQLFIDRPEIEDEVSIIGKVKH